MTIPRGLSDGGNMATDLIDRIGARLASPDLWPDDHARLRAMLTIPLIGRGVDVGCSDGGLLCRWLAAWPDATASALDVRDTQENVRLAADRCGVSARVRFTRGSVWDLPSTEAPYDWMTLCEIIEHLPPFEADHLLNAAISVCRLDAKVIITVPSRECVLADRERWSFADHKQFFTADSLYAWLYRSFRYVSVERIVDGIWLLAECRV